MVLWPYLYRVQFSQHKTPTLTKHTTALFRDLLRSSIAHILPIRCQAHGAARRCGIPAALQRRRSNNA